MNTRKQFKVDLGSGFKVRLASKSIKQDNLDKLISRLALSNIKIGVKSHVLYQYIYQSTIWQTSGYSENDMK